MARSKATSLRGCTQRLTPSSSARQSSPSGVVAPKPPRAGPDEKFDAARIRRDTGVRRARRPQLADARRSAATPPAFWRRPRWRLYAPIDVVPGGAVTCG